MPRLHDLHDVHAGDVWRAVDHICRDRRGILLGGRLAFPRGIGLCHHRLAGADLGNVDSRLATFYATLDL